MNESVAVKLLLAIVGQEELRLKSALKKGQSRKAFKIKKDIYELKKFAKK